MPTITPTADSPVGLLVAHRPARARILERLGIDYCCGGRKTLAQACTEKHLPLADVLRQLDAAPAPEGADRDWTSAAMSELADHIEATHHAFLRDELPRARHLITKVLAAHGRRHPELDSLSQAFDAFADELTDHMLKEERVLFPWARRLETGQPSVSTPPWSVQRPVDCMIHEHEAAARALARMRELTRDYTPPPDACPTYRAMLDALASIDRDLRTHVHLENNILFPAAIHAEAARARPTKGAPSPEAA